MQQRAAALLGKRLKSGPRCRRSTRSASASSAATPVNSAIRPTLPSTIAATRKASPGRVLREIKVADALLRPGDLLYFISRWKSAAVRPEEAAAMAQTDKEHLAAAAYRRYQNALEGRRRGGFRRLAACAPRSCFATFPKAGKAEAERFDHVLVDEYQDTNGSQYRIVKALAVGPSQPVRGGRRRPVDLRLARCRSRAHPALQKRLARGQGGPPGNQLPLDPRNRRMGQPPDRLQQAAPRQGAAGHVRRRAAAHPATAKTKSRRPKPSSTKSPRESSRTSAGPRISPSSAAPTSSRGRSRWSCAGRKSLTCSWAACRSTTARKSATSWPISKCWPIRADEASLLRIINMPARGIGQTTVKRLMDEAIRQGKPMCEILPHVTSSKAFVVGR